MRSKVQWFNDAKGYGMIAHPETEAPIFMHYTAIETEGFKTLAEGQTVDFDLVTGPKGPQATNVRKVLS